jgi:hypothetical protein
VPSEYVVLEAMSSIMFGTESVWLLYTIDSICYETTSHIGL